MLQFQARGMQHQPSGGWLVVRPVQGVTGNRMTDRQQVNRLTHLWTVFADFARG